MRKYVPLARADGKGRKVKEAGVRRGYRVAVRHGDGDGGSGYLTVGVRCLNRHVIAGAAGVCNEARGCWSKGWGTGRF